MGDPSVAAIYDVAALAQTLSEHALYCGRFRVRHRIQVGVELRDQTDTEFPDHPRRLDPLFMVLESLYGSRIAALASGRSCRHSSRRGHRLSDCASTRHTQNDGPLEFPGRCQLVSIRRSAMPPVVPSPRRRIGASQSRAILPSARRRGHRDSGLRALNSCDSYGRARRGEGRGDNFLWNMSPIAVLARATEIGRTGMAMPREPFNMRAPDDVETPASCMQDSAHWCDGRSVW